MPKLNRVNGSNETRESLFELQIDAFLDGLADEEPNPEEFGLSEDRAQEIIGESMLRNHIALELD